MANTRVTNPVTDFDKTNTTQGLKLPSGTNSNQPTGVQGMLRNDTDETVNSSASALAHYNGTEWRYFAASVSSAPYSFEYLVVAGGGGGGGGEIYANGGGGGGAGGYYTATSSVLNTNTDVSVTIGQGGTAGPNSYTTQLAGSGGDTWVNHVTGGGIYGRLTCSGGGGGASGNGALAGANGGSGGGGKQSGSSGGTGLGFTGEQVADGGDGAAGTGGGGGGAGQNGFDAVAANGGGADGGDGLSSSITGTATYYAGGGAGAGYYFGNAPGGGTNPRPLGGQGGGGNASINASTSLDSPQDGSPNTGGGGGARNCWNNAGTGGAGGSGVVIFKIANANYSGTVTGSPTVDTSSVTGYTILKFTGSGSYTV